MRSIGLGAAAIVLLGHLSAYAGGREDRQGGISSSPSARRLLGQAAAIAAAVGLVGEVQALKGFPRPVREDLAPKWVVYPNAVVLKDPSRLATAADLVEVIFSPGALELRHGGRANGVRPSNVVTIHHWGLPGLRYASMRDGERGLVFLGRPFRLPRSRSSSSGAPVAAGR